VVRVDAADDTAEVGNNELEDRCDGCSAEHRRLQRLVSLFERAGISGEEAKMK
jgi:hypothetical protein